MSLVHDGGGADKPGQLPRGPRLSRGIQGRSVVACGCLYSWGNTRDASPQLCPSSASSQTRLMARMRAGLEKRLAGPRYRPDSHPSRKLLPRPVRCHRPDRFVAERRNVPSVPRILRVTSSGTWGSDQTGSAAGCNRTGEMSLCAECVRSLGQAHHRLVRRPGECQDWRLGPAQRNDLSRGRFHGGSGSIRAGNHWSISFTCRSLTVDSVLVSIATELT